MSRKALLFTLFIFLLQGLSAQNARALIGRAGEFLQEGEYQQALSTYQLILMDQDYEPFHPAATLGMGKVFLGTGNLEQATDIFGTVQSSFPGTTAAIEAHYQAGRINIYRGEYELAIQSLTAFVQNYPQDDNTANALFWTGEAAYRLGQWESARDVFMRVLTDFPRNSKIEAIQYRLSLIELNRRQENLLKLLQWSQEEAIQNLGEFREREKSYEQSIREFQQRLARFEAMGIEEDDSELLADLRSQIEQKDQIIANLQLQLAGEYVDATGEAEIINFENFIQLLRIKERLLDHQTKMVNWALSREGGQ